MSRACKQSSPAQAGRLPPWTKIRRLRATSLVEPNDRVICTRCRHIVVEPLRLPCSCDVHACKECVELLRCCPQCRRRVSDLGGARMPSYPFLTLLGSLRVSCPNVVIKTRAKNGLRERQESCTVVVPLKELNTHLLECPQQLVGCPFEDDDCPTPQITRSDYAAHVRLCGARTFECECGATLKLANREAHQKRGCGSSAPVGGCPQGCGYARSDNNYTEHIQTTCPEIRVLCSVPNCGAEFARRDSDQHYRDAALIHVKCFGNQFAELAESMSTLTNALQEEQRAHSASKLALQKEAEVLRMRLNTSQERLTLVQGELGSLKDQVASLKAKAAATSEREAEQAAEAKSAEQARAQAEAAQRKEQVALEKVRKMREGQRELEQQLVKSRTEHRTQQRALLRSVAAAEKQAASATTAANKAKEKLATALKTKEKLAAALKASEELPALREALAREQRERAQAQTQLASSERALKRLEQRCDLVQRASEEGEEKVREAQARVVQVEGEKATLSRELLLTVQDLESMSQELQTESAKRAACEVQLLALNSSSATTASAPTTSTARRSSSTSAKRSRSRKKRRRSQVEEESSSSSSSSSESESSSEEEDDSDDAPAPRRKSTSSSRPKNESRSARESREESSERKRMRLLTRLFD